MSDGTTIEWTDATWNPTTGCDRVSPGCDNCYALALAKRLKAMGNTRYQVDGGSTTSGPGFGLTLHVDKLAEPLKWRTPKRVFVNSMSDLFHVDVPYDFVRAVFETMGLAPHHVFQLLTKRPGRMRLLLHRLEKEYESGRLPWAARWPLHNVWIGVSVEDQQRANARVPELLRTPAVIRFLSCEPLLERVDLTPWLNGLDWVIVGGESGPRFRSISRDWVRQLRDQCALARVEFFLKQWGGRTSKAGGRELDGRTWDDMPLMEGRRRSRGAVPFRASGSFPSSATP